MATCSTDRTTWEACRQLAADLGQRFRPCSLENFEVYDPRQEKVLAELRELQPHLLEHVNAGKGLIFYGPPGTGKDHLAAAMLKGLALQGCRARWWNMQLVYARAADLIAADASPISLVHELVKPQVVCLSDPVLPIGQTEANLRMLYRIVTERYDRLRATWITINVRNAAEAVALLTEPIFSRLRDGALRFYCDWEDYRCRRK